MRHISRLLLCGLYYYAYNECGFRVLDSLDAVSQAVANSAKRVVILFFAVYFLGESASTIRQTPPLDDERVTPEKQVARTKKKPAGAARHEHTYEIG